MSQTLDTSQWLALIYLLLSQTRGFVDRSRADDRIPQFVEKIGTENNRFEMMGAFFYVIIM